MNCLTGEINLNEGKSRNTILVSEEEGSQAAVIDCLEL